jgi:hypothetical protein
MFDSDLDFDLGLMSPQATFFKDIGSWNKMNTRRTSVDGLVAAQKAALGCAKAAGGPQSPQGRVIPIQIQRQEVGKTAYIQCVP